MRLWTVHEPRNPANAGERADRTVFVKDGFSWPGLIFPLPWLLIQRLWLGTLVFVLIAAAAALAGARLPLTENAGLLLALIANLFVGFEGNDMRRRKLDRLRFVQAGSVLARDRAEAEAIFFAARGDAAPDTDLAGQAPPSSGRSVPVSRTAGSEVLGLFPQPGGQR